MTRGNLVGCWTGRSAERAKARKAELALGVDLQAEKKARRASITVSELFEDYVFPYTKDRKRSHGRDVEMYKLRIEKRFGAMRLCDVTRRDAQLLHTQLAQEGLAGATCDHYVKLLRSAFNHAVRWELSSNNVLSGIKLYNADNRVENVPDKESLERLLRVLQTDKNRTVCLLAQYLLATAARLSEALESTWGSIDRNNRVWRIPASNSKSKRIRSVPLSDAALDVINQLTTEGKYEYLFVNEQTGKPYTTIYKVWCRIRRKAGVPKLRLHDLRHCAASWMVSSGVSLFIVGEVLGHSDPKITMRYAHVANKAKLDASNAASKIIKASMPDAVDAKADDVVPGAAQQAA